MNVPFLLDAKSAGQFDWLYADATDRRHSRAVSRRLLGKFEVRTPGECWPWRGPFNAKGYGRFFGRLPGVATATIAAHRAVWTTLVGPIPDDLTLDHLCLNKACVNPAHLEPVTSSENSRRQMAPGWPGWESGECPHGHSLDGNLYVRPSGKRCCRACRRIADAASRRSKRPDTHSESAAS